MESYTGQISVFDGTSWHSTAASFPNLNEPWTLSCGSRTMCVASSGVGLVRVFNGHRWSAPTRLGSAESSASGVSCVSATFCMAIASWGATWRYDGTSWHKITINAGPYAVSCTGANFCAEVDTNGVQLFDGTAWAPSTTLVQPDSYPYAAIDCASRSLCVVASTGDPIVVGTGG
jgi:hypothetical protein